MTKKNSMLCHKELSRILTGYPQPIAPLRFKHSIYYLFLRHSIFLCFLDSIFSKKYVLNASRISITVL